MLLGLTLAFMLLSCEGDAREASVAPPPLLVFAAADLQLALGEVARGFHAAGGARADLVLGSTGQLASQIEHGAPADIFLAANEVFLDALIAAGHVDGATRVVYGVGRLALVAAPGVRLPESLEGLTRPEYGAVAIANPEHAPYGVAAREALAAAGVLDAVGPRLVFAENVMQAWQFVRTGNADAGLVALGLVVGVEPVAHREVDERLHAPLLQTGGVVSRSSRRSEAESFLAFLTAPEGRRILARYGFAPEPAR